MADILSSSGTHTFDRKHLEKIPDVGRASISLGR